MAQSRKNPSKDTDDARNKKLGEVLREAREHQGLDFAQLSEMTKLRPHILEALEKEEWHAFSAPVFIRGFLRSYAAALKLDVAGVLKMYDEKNPPVDSAPRPLSSLSAARRRTPVFFLLLVLLAAAAFFALHYASKKAIREELPVLEKQKTAVKTSPDLPTPPAKENTAEEQHKGKPLTQVASPQVKPAENKEEGIQEKPSPPEALKDNVPVQSVKKQEPLQEKTDEPAGNTPQPLAEKTAPPPVKELILKAEVTETTWVKVILDGGAPKEYIFQPGSRPEWKAERGFELSIGNAGGITLELNGKKMDNLGGHGKVVHLKLP